MQNDQKNLEALYESILEKGSLLIMAKGVIDRLKYKKINRKEAIKHLNDILKYLKNTEERIEVENMRDSLMLREELVLEQPHINFSVDNYEILFDPELENLSFDEGVDKFKRILKGELIYGKYNSEIQIPKELRQRFCQELVNDALFMNFIKGWSAKRSSQGKTYTVDRFLRNTGIIKFL
jgi:hypothetical protein